MATVRLVEATDSDIGYGYLTVDNVSQEEIEKTVLEVRKRLQTEMIDEDGVPYWDIEDFKEALPGDWDWDFEEREYEVGI